MDMTEQERIEEINCEQLATATDRVLLASRFGRARPSSAQLQGRGGVQLAQGSQVAHLPSLARDASFAQGFARGSQPHLHSSGLYAPQSDAPLYPHAPARESSTELALRARTRNDDLTVFTRRPKHYKAAWSKFATTALVTSLISVATAIALLV